MEHSSNKTRKDDNQWKTVALSFVVGAASMSLVWYAKDRRRWKRRLQQHDHDNSLSAVEAEAKLSSDVAEKQSRSLKDSSSFIDTVKQRVDDIRSRIGELPSRVQGQRGRWPWETIHKNTKVNIPSDDSINIITGDNPVRSPSVASDEEKDELCIGSIFGLDVGGTLAKLIYFEQRPDFDIELQNVRERNYHRAASAQAVLKARRGHHHPQRSSVASAPLRERSFSLGLLRRRLSASDADWDQVTREMDAKERRKDYHTTDSNDDLQDMYMVRQESVPDDLNAFASSFHIADEQDEKATVANSLAGTVNETQLKDRPAKSGGMKKSRSMFDLSISQKCKDHAEALNRFYHFARRLDSYREGVKDHKLSFYSRALGGEFHFIRFETRRMENAMELIRANDLHLSIREMGATGGGAHKYAADWDRILGIKMDKQDELDSLVAGMQFVLSTVVGECYTFRPRKKSKAKTGTPPKKKRGSGGALPTECQSRPPDVEEEKKYPTPIASDVSSDESDSERASETDKDKDNRGADEWWWSRKVQRDAISYSKTYPYLLVTIGTGVSILRVDGPRKHERISGSTIGGGTYWGLIRLLTDLEDFEDGMRLAEHGDPSKVDMLVGDIYGDNSDALEKLGLPASLVASSFGKLVTKENPAAGLKQEDLARALLLMVTNNIGQVAYLNAKLHKTPRIYFGGNFLRGNKLSQRRLSFAIDFWSKGEMEALFLEHEGYFGALGAFLLSQDISLDDLEPPHKQEVSKGGLVLSRHDPGCVDQLAFRHHRRSQTMEENMFA